MKCILAILAILFLYTSAYAQRPEDWSYISPDITSGFVIEMFYDDDGTLWAVSSDKLIESDGVNIVVHPIPAQPTDNANTFVVSAIYGSDGKFYVSRRTSLLAYDPVTDLWENLEYPGGRVSSMAFDAEGLLWVVSSSRMAFYDGADWTTGLLPVPLDQRLSYRKILIDAQDTKWLVTSSSICFDIPCFTPARVLRVTASDTTIYEPSAFNVDAPWVIDIGFTDDGDVITSVYDQNEGTDLLRYREDQNDWETITQLPEEDFFGEFFVGKGGMLMVRDLKTYEYRDNVWSSYLADSTAFSSRLGALTYSADTNLVVGGRSGDFPDTRSVIATLARQPYAVSGRVRLDFNENGILDGNDYYLDDQVVRVANGNYAFTDGEGSYRLPFSEADSYDVSVTTTDQLSFADPATGVQTAEVSDAAPIAENIDFSFTTDTSVTDFTVALTPSFAFRPGFEAFYQVRVTNLGYVPARSLVQCWFDSTLLNPIIPPGTQDFGGNEFVFVFDPLAFRESAAQRITFTLPPLTNDEELGQTLIATCRVSPLLTTDPNPANNTDTAFVTTRGSYDPNDITVSPAGDNAEGRVPVATTRLEYTIRFQNVGTDTAFNVVISNPIETDLDLTTLKVLDYSHDYNIDWFPDRGVAKFNFPDIRLVDSTTNETGSNGFIRYAIDLAAPTAGVVVNNDAGITNTTITTLMDRPVSATDQRATADCEASFTNYGDVVGWRFPRQAYELSVVDVNGRIVRQQTGVGDRAEIPLTTIGRGLYFISINLKSCGRKLTKKVF